MRPTSEWLNQPGGLAERLARLRRASRLTGEEMAGRLGWPRTKISKIENGRQMPSEADITAWAEACGQRGAAGELLDLLSEAQAVHRQYRHRVRRGHAAIQEELDRLVRQAKRVRNFEVSVVPGLLQTAEYARYRMAEAVRVHGFSEDGAEAAVAARMRRQDVLYEAGRQFEFIITEAALRFRLCPPQVMAGQIDRLASLSGLGNISLAVIPLDTELAVAPVHGFMIVDDLTYVEALAADDLLPPRESATYEAVADGLRDEAVTGEPARQVLLSAVARLRA